MTTTSSRPVERGAPRVQKTGPVAWTRKHLFNSWFNSILTVVLVIVLGGAFLNLVNWAFNEAPWEIVTNSFGQFMAGIYPRGAYWRLWSALGIIMSLAGLSWGVLARNQKKLFTTPILVAVGLIVLALIVMPMTRPYLPYSLGNLALLLGCALLGRSIGSKFPKAAQFISAGWFVSYFAVLYLFGGNNFFESLFYLILIQLGGSLFVGWQLASRVTMPTVRKIAGKLGLFAVGFFLGYQVLGNVLYSEALASMIGGYTIFLLVMVAIGILLGILLLWLLSDEQIVSWIGAATLFVLGFGITFFLVGGLPEWLGLDVGLKRVSTTVWGGLSLTLLLAVSGIVLCFPAGVLLALGRRSKLPLLRAFSVAYIELVRGIPLIAILFMGQVLIPLFLPEGIRPDSIVRAVVGLTIFSAAYLAENVRAGLQSIPQGQSEAAQSLGLNKPLTMALIVLPQALKTAIPAIVGQFISLFQDTTLLGIVGLTEFLGITKGLLADPRYIGDYAPAYAFIGIVYWVFCYAMSYGSRRIEFALNTDLR